MKKLICVLLACAFFITGCSNAPKTEDLYDRVVELVESAYELNTVFFGAGLPVYDRELEVYKDLYENYSFYQYTQDRDIVSDRSKFSSEEEIKSAAEKVYSKELLEEILYVNAFVGQILTDVPGGEASYEARFLSDGEYIYYKQEVTETDTSPLIFDYANMKVVRPSNKTRVQILLPAWTEDAPDLPFEFRLTLTKNEDGIWLLDKLTV